MTVAIVAEKPSVGRDLAKVLGATKQGQGYLQGNGYVVTWAVGHLVTIAEPHVMEEKWKKWRLYDLPMIPKEWRLATYEKLKDQFEVVRRILLSEQIEKVICATDAGREGELIFRYIYESTGCTKPVERLWISSLTQEAIAEGFKALRPAKDFDNLAAAASARSRADWLVGLNLSRLYSLRSEENYSVGRVQTPTLAMIVEREKAIQAFVPEDYGEIHVTLLAGVERPFPGTLIEAPASKSPQISDVSPSASIDEIGAARESTSWASAKPKRFAKDGDAIKALVKHLKATRTGTIHWQQSKKNKIPPPMFFDLTELQRHANRLYGYSAQQVLEYAQALYEQRKLLTYPRTDSRHLSKDVAAQLPKVLSAVSGSYPAAAEVLKNFRTLNKRFVDDGEVTDHHAIIPTPIAPRLDSLPEGEARIYDLVVRRLLAAWYPDHVVAISHVVSRFPGIEAETEVFTLSTGTVIEVEGWKEVEPVGGAAKSKAKKKGVEQKTEAASSKADTSLLETALPKGLVVGRSLDLKDVRAVDKSTRPPQRLNDASLLSAMESAGKSLTDKRLSDAMKERGLGTPATRASIIEILLSRQYIKREGKAFFATERGIRLIDNVDPTVKSPEMTGAWEARLKDMEKGKEAFAKFMHDVEEYVREVVGRGVKGGSPSSSNVQKLQPSTGKLPSEKVVATRDPIAAAKPGGVTPTPLEILQQRFQHQSFLPYQREAIEQVLRGQNVLVVMPTGAGKSLCYQLSALARGRCGVVVSPLIALMDDQVFKLRQLGIRAMALHGGMSREQSRAVCIEYLQGRCELLYITPERLGVPGFPEMLAKFMPALIAIDEAHCISQWGHDFRPDYRMIRDRLLPLSNVPLVAVTATATPQVRQDIVQQLGREKWDLQVHGFWRDNLALEVKQVKSKDRLAEAVKIISMPTARPAIIYAPTRKGAEEWAKELSRTRINTAVYHAGLPQAERRQAQEDFVGDKVDVIVATIAFGMGVDKPNVRTVLHAAMPSSIESYYQEVGRAGRDGKPSRCILLTSDEDMRSHNYHIQKDYPLIEDMEKVLQAIGETSVGRERLVQSLDMESELLDRCLEKLWLHGALVLRGDDQFSEGVKNWVSGYLAQRDERVKRLGEMLQFCRNKSCRMQTVVSYFGDERFEEAGCRICDNCRSGDAAAATRGGKEPAAFSELILDAEAQTRLVKLKEWRKRIGEAEGLPLYRVVNNGTLDALARQFPHSLRDLEDVKGMGPKLRERYGSEILQLLNRGDVVGGVVSVSQKGSESTLGS